MVLQLRDRILAAGGNTRPLTRDELLRLASEVDLRTLDLGEYECFQRRCYARNTVLLNDSFELVVICWLPGQASSVHDHGESLCLYLVVRGHMKEERFSRVEGKEPEPAESRRFGPGEITIAQGDEIHRISNDGEEQLTTLHVYSPPLVDNTNFTPVPTYS